MENGVLATTMAVRERLMEYFKGTCVERFTTDTNVAVYQVDTPRLQYMYQRREWERRRKSSVLIGDLPIMVVQHSPEQVVFYQKILERSPELRDVYNELILFMEKYLRAVEVIHDQKGVFYAND